MKSLIEQLKELRDAAEKRISRHSSYDEGKVAAYNAAIVIAEAHEVDGNRIEELMEGMIVIQGGVEAAARRIRDLHSQLAWTSVSAGLPTEPGMYEFLILNPGDGVVDALDAYRLEPENQHPWFDMCHARRINNEELAECEYTHFRRIELPEGT